MGGSSSVRPPTADDQTGANVEAGLATNILSNPNYITPFGTISRHDTGQYAVIAGQRVPYQDVRVTLPPDVQRRLEQQNYAQANLGNLSLEALRGVGRVATSPVDLRGIPEYLNQINSRQIQTELQPGNLPNVTGSGDFGAERTAIETRAAEQNRRRVDERFRDEEDRLRQRLANQGLRAGSQAYDDEVRKFQDTRNRAYQEANDAAFNVAGQEQSRLAGLNLSARNLLFGEAQNRGAFFNAAQQAELNQALQRAQFQNQNRANQLQEYFYLRDRPLQEYRALAGEAGTPSAPPIPSGGGAPNIQAGNLFQAYGAAQSGQRPSFLSQIAGPIGSIAGSAFSGGLK